MHMDVLAARRTLAGLPVVHGIHTLLWTLECLFRSQSDLSPVTFLKATFRKMVYLGDPVQVFVTHQSRGLVSVSATVNDVPVTSVDLGLEPLSLAVPPMAGGPLLDPAVPICIPFEKIGECRGRLPFGAEAAKAVEQFPAVAASLGICRVAALARLSALVGMVCPGLHSLFKGLSLVSDAADEDYLDFEVTKVNSRIRQAMLAVKGGGWHGAVEAFVRPEPVEQPSIEAIVRYVVPGEFAGARALVVGGSRGLGELTAKILACGGGEVIVTYAVGADDASRVQSEIADRGGRCDTLRYDVTNNGGLKINSLMARPNQLYYMATPQIFHRKTGAFDSEKFLQFLSFYVLGFYNTCKSLNKTTSEPISIFYPSTVAIDNPSGMAEYAMAKAAGEILCSDLHAFTTFGPIVVERLPRLPSDQTTSLIKVNTADPIEAMLKVIRRVHAGSKRDSMGIGDNRR